MPYYNGRWNKYSESERKAFGQRKREEESSKWHKKYISRARLKSERNWTDSAINKHLPKPKNAGPIKAWERKIVLKAEKKPDFIMWMMQRIAKQKKDDPPVDYEAERRNAEKQKLDAIYQKYVSRRIELDEKIKQIEQLGLEISGLEVEMAEIENEYNTQKAIFGLEG